MADVYFLPIEKIEKFNEFLDNIRFFNIFTEKDIVGLKIHFGNSGHKNQIPPIYIKPIVEKLKNNGVSIFLTDTNVLYKGERSDTFSHLGVVYKNRFNEIGIPILIAGGFNGDYEFEIEINGDHFKKLYFAKEYREFTGMVAITHFKGHMLSGIGGTIKNMGMGCASRKGKFAMHSKVTPLINLSICKGCRKCESECLFGAIYIKDNKSYIDINKCKGCAWCIHVCPFGAISIPWSSVSSEEFQERLCEYAYGIIKFYKNKFFAINFLINITGDCDCLSNPGNKLLEDIGILISDDPVAIDKCSIDLIKRINGKDIFKKLRPNLNHLHQLFYGEKLGLGSTKYNLIEV
ncbi:MAG: DUF362 domain-containing protein [Candidatus Omnitrophica bacterium]|nr:DUF362 domain-containing protein [Candidatus Omnitrophota bacterium]